MSVNVVHIRVDTSRFEKDSLEKAKGLLKSYPGNSPVYLHLLSTDREVVIAAPDELKVAPSEKFIKDIETLLGQRSVVINTKV